MQSLMKRLYIYSALKFIICFIFTLCTCSVAMHSYRLNAGIFPAVMGAGLTVLFLIKFFYALVNGRKEIDAYLERSEYTEYELEDEYRRAINMGPVKMGLIHIYFLTETAAHIVPISEIFRISIKKRRRSKSVRYYYILEMSHMGSMNPVRLSFNNSSAVHNLINTLMSRNPNIEYIPLDQFDPFGFSSIF